MKHIGGQAVMEGVMMQSPSKLAVCVRLPNGKLRIKKEKVKKTVKVPFIRGAFVLYHTLIRGIKTLLWSADQQLDEHEKITKKDIFFTLAFTILFAIGFFWVLPYALTFIIGIQEETKPILFNLIDGVIKIILLLGYLMIISLMKDIRRVFQYHGAEHKTVNCYEDKKKLTIENVKKHSKVHARCGTSFIIIVLLIGVLLFSVLPAIVMYFNKDFINLNFWARRGILITLRILLIPVVASISYELLRLGDRFKTNKILGLIILPGTLVQKITTKEPDKKQIEVAIKALNSVLR